MHTSTGDWYRAKCIWQHAHPHAASYSLLAKELRKSNSYPLLRQKGGDTGLAGDVFRDVCAHSLGVFVTSRPVLEPQECRRVIDWAEAHAGASGTWTTSRHYAVPTTDIPVHEVPELLEWFCELLTRVIGPVVHSKFAGLFVCLCA